MFLITPKVEAYCEAMTSSQDALREEVMRNTATAHEQAHMMSSALQGMFLQMISCMLRPMKILEIGTFTGYSALCLAEGLADEGELHTIELREADAKLARGYFDRSKHAAKIISHTGDAKEIVNDLEYGWDLIFIDADKTGYIDYYELTLPRLKAGGFILADNTLFHGQVLEKPVSGKSAKAIQAFNEHVQQDERVLQVMLSVRDGLTLIQKRP